MAKKFWNINWKKSIVAGIIAGIVAVIISLIVTVGASGFTTLLYEQSANIWKPMTPMSEWLATVYIIDIIEWIIFGLIFSLLYKAVPGKGWERGTVFGFLLWLVGTVPGMIMTYMAFAVPDALVWLWTIQGLIIFLVAGAVLASVYDALKWKS